MMMDKHNVSYHSMVAMPPIMTLVLWLLTGFPDTAEQTMGTYYVQLAMTVITLAAVPLLLKYVSRERCGAQYKTLCRVRMGVLEAISVANMVLYFLFCSTPAFFYLGVISWLAMFFAYPQNTKDDNDSLAS